jgi:hypothetical protein
VIYIDFQGGAHGNYLEFVCNKFLAGVLCNESPFNKVGASHSQGYIGDKKFQRGHYFEKSEIKFIDSKIISIQINYDDLLPLSSISLLRAGDYDIDNDKLEINTYHKFNNQNYKWVLENLIKNFFQTQIQDSYYAVKDDSWPNVSSINEFNNLPKWILDECKNVHNLKFLQLNDQNPHCPRYVLREFFKIGFRYPDQSGFITQQKKMIYDSSNDVWVFPFRSFYSLQEFLDQIRLIGKWYELPLQNLSELEKLHEQFLAKQPYKDSKKFCDQLIKKIHQKELFVLPKLDLLQESYISGELEKYYDCELSTERVEWYKHSKEILEEIK